MRFTRLPCQINLTGVQVKLLGFSAGWMILIISIVVLTCFVKFDGSAVPNGILTLALWFSLAVCYAAKGAVSLLHYRTHQHAA